MKRVVGLAAFCCMALNVGIVLSVEAESSLEMNPNVREYLRMREEDPNVKEYFKIRKDPSVKEYFKIKKDPSVQEYFKIRKSPSVQEYFKIKKDPKVKEYINRKRNSNIESNSENESINSVSNNSRRERKNEDRVFERDSGYDADNESSDSEQTSQKRKKRKKNRNRKNRNRNRSNRNNMTNQNYQMNQIKRENQVNDEFALNEPIIDSTRIKKSSVVVEKDIKLANKDESKNVEKKISPIELSPLDKKEVLAQTDSTKDLKLAANFDDSEKEIKEKLLQINNERKNYNLIKTPEKKLKNNIKVNKFREELDRYRKLYSTDLKKA